MLENDKINHLEKILLFVLIFSLIFLQRIALPVGGYQFSPVFIASLLLVIILFLTNRIEIHPQRLVFFLISVAGVFGATIFAMIHYKEVRLASLFLLVIFYIPFIFISDKKGMFAYIIAIFQGSMIIVAIGGIIQFLLQVVGMSFFDPIQDHIPEAYRLIGYANQLPIYSGSPIMKSNGFVMLEPSFYSKFIATAIVIEFITKRRIFVLILFCSALLFCFSGTGLIILAIAAIPMLMKLKPAKIVFLILLLMVPTFTFFEKGYGDIFIERLEEFNNPNMSGYIRFIAPWLAFNEFLTLEDTGTVLFGNGAGTLTEYRGREFTFNENSGLYKTAHAFSSIKLYVEYGIAGGFLFSIFLIYIFLTNKQNRLLNFSLFINYTFLTVSLQQPQTVYLCLVLCMLSREEWVDSEAFVQLNKQKSRILTLPSALSKKTNLLIRRNI